MFHGDGDSKIRDLLPGSNPMDVVVRRWHWPIALPYGGTLDDYPVNWDQSIASMSPTVADQHHITFL